MPRFLSQDGVGLAYDDLAPAGDHGRTILLLHGFASNRHEAWRRTGWYAALERRSARCIALDHRGHGESDRPHDPAAYGLDRLVADALGLLDHLGIGRVDLLGYSMGARAALAAAIAAPERVSNLILGGVGERLLDTAEADREPLVEAMLADAPEAIEDPLLRSFRHFADEQGEDRLALAAFSQAPAVRPDASALGRLLMPVLVVAGARDELAGDPEALAACFPAGHGVSLPGCDHFSAIPHALTKAAVFDFLDGLLDDPFPGL